VSPEHDCFGLQTCITMANVLLIQIALMQAAAGGKGSRSNVYGMIVVDLDVQLLTVVGQLVA